MTCLEAADKMTASEEEVTWAKEDGIQVINSQTFNEITAENGKVTGVSITGIRGFYFDQGKAIYDKIEGSDQILPADTVIFAVGQHPFIGPDFGLELMRGRIVTDAAHKTSVDGIYSVGDCVTGTQSVIKAVAAAREAVSEIDKYLGGDGNIEENLAPEQFADVCIGKGDHEAQKKRTAPDVTAIEERIKSFEPMDLGFDCSKAGCEAGRCLQCDLRLKIAPQKFWSDYVPAGEEA